MDFTKRDYTKSKNMPAPPDGDFSRPGADASASSGRPGFCTVLWYFLVPIWVARILALALTWNGLEPDLPMAFMRGFFSDFFVTAVAAFMVFVLQSRFRFILKFSWGLWATFIALNVEHIRFNGGNANFMFSRLGFSPEFIMGSVFSSGTLTTLAVVMMISLVMVRLISNIGRQARAINAMLAVAMFAASLWIVIVVPLDSTAPGWRQMSILEENALDYLDPPFVQAGDDAWPDKAMARDLRVGWDVSGDLVINKDFVEEAWEAWEAAEAVEAGVPMLNVLFVVLEGISYSVTGPEHMPRLAEFASRGINYTQFVGLQRQSHRGLYALFCGNYPNMLSTDAKSDIMGVVGASRPCLPEILSGYGYNTEFFQSATLKYESRNKFAPAAGFKHIRQAPHSEGAGSQNGWGVDDRQLFQGAYQEVATLTRAGRPWFLGVFTSGTHHPYNVPGNGSPTYEEAVRYADTALGEFVDALEREGRLKDTLLVITSDESSREYSKSTEQIKDLDNNHIPLVIIPPGSRQGPIRQEDVFMQSDLQISVLDYLGLELEWLVGEAIGRSVFRRYGTFRPLMFGNVYTSRLFAYFSEGRLYSCNRALKCSAYELEDTPDGVERIFGSSVSAAAVEGWEVATIAEAVKGSDRSWSDVDEDYVYSESDAEYTGNQIILGGSSLRLAKGESLSWHIDLQGDGLVGLMVIITASADATTPGQRPREIVVHQYEGTARARETLEFNYDFKAPEDYKGILTTILTYADDGTRYKVGGLRIKKH